MHRRRDANIGDLACTPGHYFDFGNHKMMPFGQHAPQFERVILGGGKVYNDCADVAICRTSQARCRKMPCLPFSHKFRQFKANPGIADLQDWTCALHTVERRQDVLDDARTRNVAFYGKVMNLA
tara:strand:+ start:3770 stop:4141 length:372 start_codon:yes stop_codon:yes gene_type:complete